MTRKVTMRQNKIRRMTGRTSTTFCY